MCYRKLKVNDNSQISLDYQENEDGATNLTWSSPGCFDLPEASRQPPAPMSWPLLAPPFGAHACYKDSGTRACSHCSPLSSLPLVQPPALPYTRTLKRGLI